MLARAAVIVIGLTLTSTLDASAEKRSVSRPDGASEHENGSDVACVRFWTQARYTVGYDHLVYLENDCEEAASCVVWTDVNPEAQMVIVGALGSAFVLTFRGSPARSFTAFVRCLAQPNQGPSRRGAPSSSSDMSLGA